MVEVRLVKILLVLGGSIVCWPTVGLGVESRLDSSWQYDLWWVVQPFSASVSSITKWSLSQRVRVMMKCALPPTGFCM
jgi:hypothetical protein